MTNSTFVEFAIDIKRRTEELGQFVYPSRSSRLQKEAVADLTDVIELITNRKDTAIRKRDEQSANMLLAIELFCTALKHEILTWIKIKQDDPNAAWDHLVSAQSNMRRATVAHPDIRDLESHEERMANIEKTAFPHIVFMSVGMVYEHSECTICGMQYENCDHVAGLPYMGQICSKILKEIKIDEVSMVEEPANKHARVSVFNDNGIMRDHLSFEPVRVAKTI